MALPLEKDAGNAFVVDCNGLLLTQYTAMVYSEDTEEIQYDKTVYTVYISVYYGDDEKLQAAVVIERQAGADGIPGGKEPMVRFANSPLNATLPPTATPAPVTPTPSPPYTEKFIFTKVWSGDREESIDWVMYNGDGTVRSKLFNKKIVSEYEWQYEAYFQHNVDDCYIVEYVPDGYMVRYENVGEYAHVTDRCHNGGTIINSKVPQTGDTLPVEWYVGCIVVSIMGLILLARAGCKRRTQ